MEFKIYMTKGVMFTLLLSNYATLITYSKMYQYPSLHKHKIRRAWTSFVVCSNL